MRNPPTGRSIPSCGHRTHHPKRPTDGQNLCAPRLAVGKAAFGGRRAVHSPVTSPLPYVWRRTSMLKMRAVRLWRDAVDFGFRWHQGIGKAGRFPFGFAFGRLNHVRPPQERHIVGASGSRSRSSVYVHRYACFPPLMGRKSTIHRVTRPFDLSTKWGNAA